MTYSYDAYGRLLSTTYPNGNIQGKSDVGRYTYGGSRPHAVTRVENTGGLIPREARRIAYTPFNKVGRVTEVVGGKEHELVLTYGPDRQRVSARLSVNGRVTETRFYAGDFERVLNERGTAYDLLHVYSPDGLVCVVVNNLKLYATTDHLGSLVSLHSKTGVRFYRTYDAWGQPRLKTSSYSAIRRGFCMRGLWGGSECSEGVACEESDEEERDGREPVFERSGCGLCDCPGV